MSRALILAAGLGTRLGSLSDLRPKPLLPVADIALVRYAVALLRGHGIDEIAVNLHHHGELIVAELGDGFHYSEEPMILGTGGALVRLGDWLTRGGQESFFVVNGKILIDVDLGAVLARHQERDAAATMVVRDNPDPATFGTVDVDEAGRVTGLIGRGHKAARACMFTGVHLVSPRLLARLPQAGASDSIREGYVPALLAGERIDAYFSGGFFHEHSTPARYLEGNWMALDGRATLSCPPGPLHGVGRAEVDGTLRPPVRIGDGARVEAGALVGPYAVVGAGSVVRAGALLERTVVWPGCVVDGAHRNSIVTPRGAVQVE